MIREAREVLIRGGFVGMACGAIAASRRAVWTQSVSDCDDCAAVGPRRCVAGGYTAHNLEAVVTGITEAFASFIAFGCIIAAI